MTDYGALRQDVEALVAKKGAVTRASVHAVLDAHPPLPLSPVVDEYADDDFDPSDFG